MPSSPERQAVSSNISQNYPYGSETEAERAAAVEKASAAFPGLREKVEAEATPLGTVEPEDHGAPVRWWVWVCPKDDFKGRLHVAGYARERHALYAVCDTHGDTYLR
jgi:hypothetical protein